MKAEEIARTYESPVKKRLKMDNQSECNDVSPMVAANELIEMMATRELPDSSSHTPKRKTQ